ncbi:MAG: ribonuclease E/G [Thermoleophilia bacterium]
MSVDRAETRVAILEDGRAAECYIERRGHRSVVGHVWKGRIENVLAGMEAAFIEVGLEKNGFLHVDEVVALGVPKRKRQIAELLKRGDEVLVQATKDPMGSKGCRLTMQLSLAGRYVVYVPFGDGVGVSKRLADDERTRLRSICGALPLESGGLIVRTAAAGASASEIARDLQHLKRLWQTLQERGAQAKAPQLLYSEADISLRVIRDLLNADVDEVLVDDAAQFERITGFLRRTSPEMADRVRHYHGERPLLAEFGVEATVRSTMDRRVPLPSGGYLVIDDTEAMTVIDVNSGRNVGRGGNRLEDTITKTNLEAASEVVRQLRLRDIGGIVIIDFIDMDDERNRRAVKAALDDALSRDRTRTFVVDISPLGLVEMTRQNISDGPREVMTEVCPTCAGVGVVPSDETRAIFIERGLRESLPGRTGTVAVTVHPRVAAVMSGEDGARLAALQEEVGVEIRLERDAGLDLDGVRTRALDGAAPAAPAAEAAAEDPAPPPARSSRRRVSSRAGNG